MSLKSTIVYNRIKKIMQSDENVGKVAAGSTYVAACALESFVGTLMGGALGVAAARSARTLTTAHLKACVVGDPLLDFCKDITAVAPELPEDDDAAAPSQAKRPSARASKPDTSASEGPQTKKARGGGRGRGRGRGRGQGADDSAATVDGEDNMDALAQIGIEEIAFATTVGALIEDAPGKEAEEEDYDA